MKRDYVICGGRGDKGGYRKGRTLGKEKVGNDPDSLTLIASSLCSDSFKYLFFSNVRWKDGPSATQAVSSLTVVSNNLKLMNYHGHVESLTDEVLWRLNFKQNLSPNLLMQQTKIF